MRLPQHLAAAVIATAVLAAPTIARANVIYNFEADGSASFGAPFLRLELTSAGTSFDLSGGLGGSPITPGKLYDGDVDRFVSLTVAGVETITPTFRFGATQVEVTFDNDGNVDSTFLLYRGGLFDVSLIGVGPTANGSYNLVSSDCAERFCAVTGTWQLAAPVQPIPEPMSLALFTVGLFGLGAAVRKRTAQYSPPKSLTD